MSTYTLWQVLHEAGYSYQQTRTWCPTGTALRKRKAGVTTTTDPDAEPKKVDRGRRHAGRAVGTGGVVLRPGRPLPDCPHPGPSWQPHEYVRNGTAKVRTLLHPADGRVRVEGATTCPDGVLHPWRKRELSEILAGLHELPPAAPAARAAWERWQQGLSVKPTLPTELPPLRMLLVLDNLAGHEAPALVLWLFAHGVMPL